MVTIIELDDSRIIGRPYLGDDSIQIIYPFSLLSGGVNRPLGCFELSSTGEAFPAINNCMSSCFIHDIFE